MGLPSPLQSHRRVLDYPISYSTDFSCFLLLGIHIVSSYKRLSVRIEANSLKSDVAIGHIER